ncbi:MAG: phage tail protein I [Defluviitaleaceae bacterium]|nr:phage tail protein I [Defluviitaleaceae bacterium]
MNDVYEIDFTRALPPTLKNDPTTLALARTIAEPLQENIKMARLTLIYHRIDEFDHDVLDVLARDMHVDWWDDTHPVEIKRRVLRDSVRVHMRLGTRFSIRTALRNVFPHTDVQAWYEYGGTHHRFRIILDLTDADTRVDFSRLKRTMHTFNRLTIHLDDILLRFRAEKIPVVIAGGSKHGVQHLSHPHYRDLSRQHPTDTSAVAKVGITEHAIRHTVTPHKRGLFMPRYEAMPVFAGRAGTLQHVVMHTALPQGR